MEETPPNTPSAHAVFPTTQTPDAPGLTTVPQRLTRDQDEGAGSLFRRRYQEAPVKSGEMRQEGREPVTFAQMRRLPFWQLRHCLAGIP